MPVLLQLSCERPRHLPVIQLQQKHQQEREEWGPRGAGTHACFRFVPSSLTALAANGQSTGAAAGRRSSSGGAGTAAAAGSSSGGAGTAAAAGSSSGGAGATAARGRGGSRRGGAGLAARGGDGAAGAVHTTAKCRHVGISGGPLASSLPPLPACQGTCSCGLRTTAPPSADCCPVCHPLSVPRCKSAVRLHAGVRCTAREGRH